MNSGKTIFSQIIDFIPIKKFRRCVAKYNGNHRVRSFTCYDQYLCMAFAQLTYRESLRDIECCLRAVHEKLYHIGIRGKVSRSTLSDANENRDWRIYRDFAYILIVLRESLHHRLGNPYFIGVSGSTSSIKLAHSPARFNVTSNCVVLYIFQVFYGLTTKKKFDIKILTG